MSQLEREEEAIEQAYERGEIDLKQRNKELRDLYRDYRAEAEESAQRAYDEEMERW